MSGHVELELCGLNVTYCTRKGAVQAVKNCSFTVRRGAIVGLVGESGSGKSSALMAIPALLPQGTRVSGRILYGGKNLLDLDEQGINAHRWRSFALVSQGAGSSFTPHLSIGRHITEVLAFHLKMTAREAKERALALLRTVELDGTFFGRYPHELSGGQKQRAALAAALACDPDFLLCDEPTTALDVVTQKEVLDMAGALVRERAMGLLLVTHDLPLAARFCDTLVVLRNGTVVENGPTREVIARPQEPYTKSLIEALRRIEESDLFSVKERGNVGDA